MSFKKRATKSIALALVGITGATPLFNSIYAFEQSNLTNSMENKIENQLIEEEIKINNSDIQELNDLMDTGVFSEFDLDKNDNLILNKSIDQLVTEYKLSAEQVSIINLILNPSSINNVESKLSFKWEGNAVRVTLTSNDVVAFFSSAAMIGPAAIKAALIGLGTVVGGPMGAAIASAIALLSTKHIISFGSVVLAATSKNRGMYIKIGIGIFDYGVL